MVDRTKSGVAEAAADGVREGSSGLWRVDGGPLLPPFTDLLLPLPDARADINARD